MEDRAKLFKSGDSQAVRLPKKYRFQDAEEVLIYRQGRRIILEPMPMQRSWSRRFLALAGSAPDLPYPEEPPAGLGEAPPRQRDLSDVAGTWKEDRDFDEVIADHDRIDDYPSR